MFRESLEVSLIVGIILSFLLKTNQTKYNNTVYVGIAAGIVTSIIAGTTLLAIKAEFSGRAEEIFEGITMLIGAALLTSMIFWMMKQKKLTEQIHNKISKHIDSASKFGLFALAFVSVLREGIETVIFLSAASFGSDSVNLVGVFLGLISALFLGYLIFVVSIKINIKKFFTFTSVLLILFAAGLISHGLHEFIEAGVLTLGSSEAYNINHILNDKSALGEILKGLFGYNGNPTFIEIYAYLGYLAFAFVCWFSPKELLKKMF
jgi:high-affinity iron transporter